MRKFKLIKKLPFEGSPDIGYISIEKLGENGAHYWNHNWFHPENYPEFWLEIKEPILTTEDGYKCTLDDTVFGVLPKANWQTNYYGEKGVPAFKLFNLEGKKWNPSSEWLWFKTKENAEKYIYNNKPKFSKKQLVDIIEGNEELSDGEVIEEIYKLINK